MYTRIRRLFLGFAAVAILHPAAASAQPVIDVVPGGAGIQAAMHAACDLIAADPTNSLTVTVKVAAGTYYEKVFLGYRHSETNLVPCSGVSLVGNPADPSSV